MTDTTEIVDAVHTVLDGVGHEYDYDAVASEVHHFWTIPFESGNGLFIAVVRMGDDPIELVVEERTDVGNGEPVDDTPTLVATSPSPKLAAALVALGVTAALNDQEG